MFSLDWNWTDLFYFALKILEKNFRDLLVWYLEFLCFDVSFRNEKYAFIFNKNGFNTRTSHWILVVYRHCKIYH